MIINATQARDRSKTKNTSETSGQMVEIMSNISAACKKGEYETYYYQPVGRDTTKKLKDLGYKVKFEVDRNESYTRISWD